MSDATAVCHDCQRPYGDEHGFPDLIVPFDVWRRITPTSDDGGLLCPSCICKRLYDAGIRCEGAFMSGPIVSVTPSTMDALRRVENIELALEGRMNRWGEALQTMILIGGFPSPEPEVTNGECGAWVEDVGGALTPAECPNPRPCADHPEVSND